MISLSDPRVKQYGEMVDKNQSVKADLSKIKDPSEAVKVLAANGLVFTADEFKSMAVQMMDVSKKQTSGKLDDNAMEMVSGGNNGSTYFNMTACAG